VKPLPIISALSIVLLFLLVLPASAGYVWENVTVDSSGNVGQYSSLAFNAGYPAISYLDSGAGHLKYAWMDADGWDNETVDSNASVGWYTSLAFNADYPAISYYDAAFDNKDLKYAWRPAGIWQITTVDAVGEVGSYNSLAFNGDYPAISYHDAANDTLKYAWQDSGGWHNTIVDSSGQVGSYSSLAFNEGYPAISYYDHISNYNLKYAWKNASGWHNETVDSAGDVGQYTSLAFNGGYPAISYKDTVNGLKYAWQDADGWHNETVDSAAIAGYTSLAFTGNTPVISYVDGAPLDLKFAWKNGSEWEIATIDSEGNIGWDTSLAFNGDSPAISYYDSDPATLDLKYATGTPVGAINVTSAPAGAVVWLDGTDTGFTTPATLADVATGTHNVTATLGGFLPEVNDTVGVVFDTTTDVIFTLTPVTTPTTPTPTPTPAPDSSDGDDPMDDTAIAVAKGLAAGENVTLGLDPSLSPIYGIQVTAKGSIATLLVTARTTASPESGIPAPDGIVYQFIEVTLFKTTDDQVDHAEMMFTVPLSWLETNGVTPANIVLYRWHEGSWQPLPTTFVKEEGGKAYFTATSPGFSLFAIVAVDEPVTIAVDEEEDETPVPAEEPAADVTATDATVSPTPVTTGTAQETPAAEETTGPEPTETPASPLFVFAPVAALGALLVLGKRR